MVSGEVQARTCLGRRKNAWKSKRDSIGRGRVERFGDIILDAGNEVEEIGEERKATVKEKKDGIRIAAGL